MSDGVIFDAESAERIARVTRWGERRLRESPPIDDGGKFDPLPAPIFIEVRITGDVGTGGSGLAGSGCDIDVYPGVTLSWNATTCEWVDGDAVWVFDLNDGVLDVGVRYLTRVIESHHTFENVQRPLCEVFSGASGFTDSGSEAGSNACTIPIQWRDPVTQECQDACLVLPTGSMVVDSAGNILAGG